MTPSFPFPLLSTHVVRAPAVLVSVPFQCFLSPPFTLLLCPDFTFVQPTSFFFVNYRSRLRFATAYSSEFSCINCFSHKNRRGSPLFSSLFLLRDHFRQLRFPLSPLITISLSSKYERRFLSLLSVRPFLLFFVFFFFFMVFVSSIPFGWPAFFFPLFLLS